MWHQDLDLNSLNTPLSDVKLTKCHYCKGDSRQGYYCKFAKKQVCYSNPCSPIFELICPKAQRSKS